MAGFGQAPAFGAQALSTDATNRSASPFGAPITSSSTFGQPQQTNAFGAPAAATNNVFQQSQKPASFGFLNNATNPAISNNSSGGGVFGSSNVASNGDANGNPFATANAPSNPFATQVTTGAFSNPFSNAAPASTTAPGFGTASNPFAAAPSTNSFGGPSTVVNGSSNFFAKPNESSHQGADPFGGASANTQKRKNGFGDTGAMKRLAFDSTANSVQKSQAQMDSKRVSSSNGPVGFGVKDTRKNRNGFSDYLKEREAIGLGNKTARADSYNVNGAQKTASAYEKEIRDQLRKDNLHPPAWPRQPGNPANRQAMEDHREKYKKYEGRVRTSLIKAGLIDDPEVRKKLSDAIDFRGICQDMCPEGEKVSRIVEYDVKMAEKTTSPDGLEMWPNPDRMIKSFKRSAAGTDSPLPTEVRSPAALRRTVDYLIDDFLRSDENLPSQHNFLWDRTRAIRKDFIFQNAMSAEERTDQIYCLENIARFHAVALHLLSQENFAAEDFSEQQEREQLGKTLLSLMQVYDECKDMDGVHMDNEAEFRAYYLLFNAHDPFVMQQMQDWDDRFWFSSHEVQTAVTLIEAMQNVWNGRGPLRPQVALTTGSASFTTYFSIVEDRKVSYTMACFAEIHFTQIRRQLLKAIHRAYGRVRDGPKDLTAKVLNSILRFDTEEQCVAFLEELEMEFSTDGADEPYLVVERRRSIPGKTIRQSFSGVMVERKRGGRPLPEVIHTTVFEEATASVEETHRPDSMFVTQPAGTPGFSTSANLKTNNVDVNFSDDETPSSSPKPPIQTLSPFQKPPTTDGFATSTPTQSVLNSTPANPFSQASSNPFVQASNTSIVPPTDNSASNGKAPNFPWTSNPPANSALSHASPPEPTTDPPAEVPKSLLSAPPAVTTASTTPADGGSGSVFDFLLNKPAEKPTVSFIHDATASTSTVPSIFSTPSTTGNQTAKAEKQAPVPDSSLTNPLGVSPKPASEKVAAASTNPLFDTGSVQKPKQQSTGVSQPWTPPPLTKSLEMYKPHPASAHLPPAPQPAPPKDLMGDFAKWVVLGDNGLMEDFQEALITHLVRNVFDTYQREEEERKRKEEENRSWARARKFRIYSLRVRFFYRWRDIARKLALKRVGRQNRAALKQYRETKLAEAKAAKAKAEKEEQSRIKRLTGPSSWLDELEKDRALKRARRESMSLDTSRRPSMSSSNADALLATGIFSGMENQRELAANCVRDDDSLYDALVGVTIHPNPSQQSMGPPARPKDPLRSVRAAAVAKPAPKPKLSKKAQYLQDLMSGKHREDDLISFRSSDSSRMARSVPSGGKVTNFSRYQSSSPRSSAEPERSKHGPGSGIKSPYWLLRSRGLFATPTGHVLSDKAPRPVMSNSREGGSEYSGDSDAGDIDDRVLEQDGAYRASLGLTGSRRSTFSVPQSAAGSPPRHSFLKPKPAMARQSLPAGMSPASLLASQHVDIDAVSQTGSAVSTLQQDAEESLRELKRVAAELDSETEWYREQNKQMSQGQQAFGA
jgi:nuclear mRNA export protein SAC3